VTGEDIVQAMKNLGFDNYITPLEIYLARYKEVRQFRFMTEYAGSGSNNPVYLPF
jgi:hypothetical protein